VSDGHQQKCSMVEGGPCGQRRVKRRGTQIAKLEVKRDYGFAPVGVEGKGGGIKMKGSPAAPETVFAREGWIVWVKKVGTDPFP